MQAIKVKEKHNGKYNKGESGNLKGRPIETKEAMAKLRKFTDKRSATAYKHLAKAIEANEPWAIQLYFQELLPRVQLIDENNHICEK